MRKLKFAIIGPETENTFDLVREVENRGHKAEIIFLSHIYFFFDGDMKVFNNGEPIEDYDIIFFRGYDINTKEAQLLAEYFTKKGKVVIDEKVGFSFYPGKIYEALKFCQSDVSCPKAYQAVDIREWKRILDIVKFPIMVKPINGKKGRRIEKFSEKEKALSFFEKKPKGYFLQEYFPIRSDMRILVVGGKVIGGFERFIKDGEFKSNVFGTPGKKIEVSPEMGELAVSASRAVECEIAGVDVFNFQGKNFVLESNFAPQWEKFKKVTGIDPAPHIVDYALKKFENKNNLIIKNELRNAFTKQKRRIVSRKS